MWGTIQDFLTADGGLWHEKLPFLIGFLFVAIEIASRLIQRLRPVIDVSSLGYIFGEGMSVTIMLSYGLALAFNKTLATIIAEKNGKVLAVAMLLAFGTLVGHIFNRWFSRGPGKH